MKSIRKAQKIVLNQRLKNQLKERDDRILELSATIDAHYHAMQGLAKILQMDNIESLSMEDVINEIKKRIK